MRGRPAILDEHRLTLNDIQTVIAVTVVVSAYVQRKGFGYHLSGLMPVLAGIAAQLIAWSASVLRRPRRPARLALTAVICGIAVLGTGKKILGGLRPQIELQIAKLSLHDMLAVHQTGQDGTTFADVVDAADYIRRTAPADRTVLVWSRLVHLNFLAERRSPTRFISCGMLVLARGPFSLAKEWTHEFERAFERPPRARSSCHLRETAFGSL